VVRLECGYDTVGLTIATGEKMKRITVFETSDGHKFGDSKQAKAHEAALSLDSIIAEWIDDTEITVEVLRDKLVAGSWPLINLLSSIARQTPLADEEGGDTKAVEEQREAA
jgi:hypothetical protein